MYLSQIEEQISINFLEFNDAPPTNAPFPSGISKIDAALRRIKDGTYGFCEDTGEPIGIKRLIARPVATLSISAQEKHEKEEKVYANDV